MFGCLEVWKFGSLEVWKFGSLEVWKFGSLEVVPNTSELPNFSTS
jgi:hypothetical protein